MSLAGFELKSKVKGSPNGTPFYCLFGINFCCFVFFGVMLQELLKRRSCRAYPCGTEQYHRRVRTAYRPYP